jgi:hypothetical protein
LIEDALKEKMNLGISTRHSQQTFPNSSPSSQKLPHVTANSQPSKDRLIIGNHFAEWRMERLSCMLCRYLFLKSEQKAPVSNFWCKLCNVPLCCNSNRNCFKNYHENEDIYLNRE